MTKHAMTAALLAIALTAQPMSTASANFYARGAIAGDQGRLAERAQAGQTGWQHGQGPHVNGRVGPRPGGYPGWRGGPGWRGAAPWHGPAGWAGRPYWFGRPWGPRPYYGTIIAGVALGTLITVAAVGYVPPRPAPNLCWYWADPYGNRGYWDYCS
jgi:hypothetical protein